MLEPGFLLEQKLQLAPQMQYALKLLQMDADVLSEYLSEQAMENPLISLDFISVSSRIPTDSANDRTDIPAPSQENSLQDNLIQQLPSFLSSFQRRAVMNLIRCLDRSGFLRESSADLMESLGISEKQLSAALQLLQSLDPPGIGAASVQESLLLQLRRMEQDTSLACAIVKNHLPDVAAGRLNKIAKAESTSLSKVRSAISLIQMLNPYPANGFQGQQNTRYITPDLIVSLEENGAIQIRLSEQSAPKLRCCSAYEHLLAHADDENLRHYLQEKKKDFTDLENAITMRAQTLLRVASCIVSRQQVFFYTGNRCLQPLSLEDISLDVGLHKSTVSRAIQGKYVLCSWGIFPLKWFLNRYILSKNASEEEKKGQSEIMCVMRQIISEEDPKHPLSDAQILLQLQQCGFNLSRRSVSVYREKLGIPSSYNRACNNMLP